MLVAALALLASAAAAEAPVPAPVVQEARLVVEREGRSARARVVLRLSRQPPALELRAVEHRTTRLELLAARMEGAPLTVEPASSIAPARAWRAAIGQAADGGPAELSLSYRVLGAFEDRGSRSSLLVPLVWPAVRGDAARPDLFRARLPLQEGHAPWETFPNVPLSLSDDGALELSLPVLPGLVRLESGEGAPPVWAPGRIADGLTLGVLSALAVIGLRALRRSPEPAG